LDGCREGTTHRRPASTFLMAPFSNINGTKLRVPKSFSGILPPSPSDDYFDYEPLAFHALSLVLTRGEIVYDVGASFGVMSALIGSLIGPSGRVFSFEPNLSTAARASELFRCNGVSCTLQTFCVGDVSRETVVFYAVNGFRSVASTRNPEILKFHPDGERIEVPMISLDDFCRSGNPAPGCLKIDVEGSEYLAVNGMKTIMREHHPDMVIETHAVEIDGIGGSLRALTDALAAEGYLLFDIAENRLADPGLYAETYADRIGNLLASTRLHSAPFLRSCQAATDKFLSAYRLRSRRGERIDA